MSGLRVAAVQRQALPLERYREIAERLPQWLEPVARQHDVVVVPECLYPGYLLDQPGLLREAVAESAAVVESVAQTARASGAYIALGIALPASGGGGITNSALLLGPDGTVRARKDKTHLWHFDERWFVPGDEVAIAETPFGRVALVICADARLTEVVRLAARAGADLVLDLANLTAVGGTLESLSNAQSDYLLGVRALENGVWLAMADKWGVEADAVTYAGRSAIYAPDGAVVAAAGSVGDAVVSAELPLGADGRLSPQPRLAALARSGGPYPWLARPLTALPAVQRAEEAVVAEAAAPFAAVAAGSRDWTAADWAWLGRVWGMGVQLAVVPPADRLSAPAPPEGTVLVGSRDGQPWVQGAAVARGELWQTPWGLIGVMGETAGLVPEVARSLMLQGAELLAWPTRLPVAQVAAVARTRALENRVFVMAAATGERAQGLIADPSGAVVAQTLSGAPRHLAAAYVALALSRIKRVVPGTDVLRGRRPARYQPLAEPTAQS